MSIIYDSIRESFRLSEALSDNVLYHVKDGPIKGNMLIANAQGIHLSQDVKGVIDVVRSRRDMKQPVFYKVALKDSNLKSPRCITDIEYWSSINISQAILDSVIQIPGLTNDEIAILKKYSEMPRTKASFVDLQYIKNIFRNHGYNAILYPNKTESNTDFDSIMLFDNQNIAKVTQIDLSMC